MARENAPGGHVSVETIKEVVEVDNSVEGALDNDSGIMLGIRIGVLKGSTLDIGEFDDPGIGREFLLMFGEPTIGILEGHVLGFRQKPAGIRNRNLFGSQTGTHFRSSLGKIGGKFRFVL